jgi:hypothetical protein
MDLESSSSNRTLNSGHVFVRGFHNLGGYHPRPLPRLALEFPQQETWKNTVGMGGRKEMLL